MKKLTRIKVFIMLLQIVTAVMFGWFVYVQTKLMDKFGAGGTSTKLAVWAIVFLGIYLLLEFTEQLVRERKVAEVSATIKVQAAKAYFQNGSEAYCEKSTEQHLSYFVNQIHAVLQQNIYLRFYLQKQLVMMMVSVVMLVIIFRECSLLIGITACSFGMAVHILSNKLTKKQTDIQEKSATFLAYLSELYDGYQEIHLNRLEEVAEEEAEKASRFMEYSLLGYRQSALKIETMGIGMNMCIYILILIAGGFLAMQGKVGIGIFIMASELSVQILNEWSMIMRLYTLVRGSEALKEELEHYLQTEGRKCEGKQTEEKDYVISLEDVCFSYEGEELILQHLNWKIEQGKKYVITGESGCGKSTLLEVIAGHYPLDSGRIRYNTKRIAYVPQNPFLFSGTLRENIVFDAWDKDEEIYSLLRELDLELQLEDFIETDGKNLSGGQCVRIALARALIHEPEVLLIDEITSSLDSTTGERIEKMLLSRYPKMTFISVAHQVYCREGYDMELHFPLQKIEVVS